MEKIRLFLKDFYNKKIGYIVKKNSFIVFLLIAFFPFGLFCLWKSNNFKLSVKLAITVIGSWWVIIFVNNTAYSNYYSNELNSLTEKYSLVEEEMTDLKLRNKTLTEGEKEFAIYRERMEPFEKSAQKIDDDIEKVKEINVQIEELPDIELIDLSDKEKITKINMLVDNLTKEQKEYFDDGKLAEYNKIMKEKEDEEKEAEKEREENNKKIEEQKKKSLDFAYQPEYPTYGEVMEFVDKLNEFRDTTLMTASFYESSDGYKNGIKLTSNSAELTSVIDEIETSKENIDSYNELMYSIALATSNFDSRIQFFIVNPLTNNTLTIIRDGVVIDTLIK